MPANGFLDDRRRAALAVYEREPGPTWRRSGFWTTSLRGLNLDELEQRRYEPSPDLPEELQGEELAGIVVQRGSSTVHVELDPELAAQGVILTSLERAVEEH